MAQVELRLIELASPGRPAGLWVRGPGNFDPLSSHVRRLAGADTGRKQRPSVRPPL